MILRRYGETLQSVEVNFDARAMTEIGFRRDRVFAIESVDFERAFEQVEEVVLSAETEGPVQDEAEEAVLEALKGSLDAFVGSLGPDEYAVVESEAGVDYPKTRDQKSNVIAEGENRLYFTWRIDPPLRMGRYRKRA